MFRFLRIRLTVLYLLGALLLVAAVDAAVYLLMQNNFQASIDLALEHRAALALHEVGEPLPSALAQGEQDWYAERGGKPAVSTVPVDGEKGEGSGGEDGQAAQQPGIPPSALWQAGEPEFDAELSPIALTAVRTDGGAESIGGGKNSFFDPSAIEAAVQNGIDFRTVDNSSGFRVRLLSLRLYGVPGYRALQVGRSLEDQDRLMGDLVKGLLEWGIAFAVLLGGLSWWLSGRELRSAQQAWEKQQVFIANAGHELRTPLTMIRAAAEVAQRRLPAGDEQRGILGEIVSETGHMGRLVEDLLLLSRLDAGAVQIEWESVDLAGLIGEVARSFGRVAQEKGVELRIGSIAGSVKADPMRLRQVLLILLDNALRHSSSGGAIEIEAGPAGRKIRLAVRDHGAGIPAGELPFVFGRFYRGREEPAGSGSGMGLAIARELVEMMRGTIRIESEPGRGTTAVVELGTG